MWVEYALGIYAFAGASGDAAIKINSNFTTIVDLIGAMQDDQHDAVTIGASANGLSLSGQALSLALATTSAAGAMSSADKTKLNGIATAATANQTDAFLLARGNHTGTQAISTVTGLQAALDGKLSLAGGTMTGDLDLGGNELLEVGGITFANGSGPLDVRGNGIQMNGGVGTGGDEFEMDGANITNANLVYATGVNLASGGHSVFIAASEVTGDWTLSLPPHSGVPGYVLTTDGNGTTDWSPRTTGASGTYTTITSITITNGVISAITGS